MCLQRSGRSRTNNGWDIQPDDSDADDADADTDDDDPSMPQPPSLLPLRKVKPHKLQFL
jgi:hypothetical protein